MNQVHAVPFGLFSLFKYPFGVIIFHLMNGELEIKTKKKVGRSMNELIALFIFLRVHCFDF